MLKVQKFTAVSWILASAAAALGCSASESDPRRTTVQGNPAGQGNTPGIQPNGGAPGSGGSTSVALGGSSSGTTAGSGGDDSCATSTAGADLVREPVDIIMVVDNSGSMQDEIDAVERNINQNFASILATSGVDYRVILISRHRKPDRETSICVSTPLSDNPSCSPPPDRPVNSARFYQYSLKVESTDSLTLILDTYDGTKADEFKLGPGGWKQWLRADAKKVFLEMTDDNSADMTADQFEQGLFSKGPENFGSAAARKYTFHSIIGIAEKNPPTAPWLPSEPAQTSICTGNGDKVENPGPVYQDLSIRSGGLRFPLCQFSAYDSVFRTIANDVVTHAQISCDFPVPAPPDGRTLDLSKVAVAYDPGDGSGPRHFGQAASAAACVPDAFYIDPATQRITLCPTTCSAAQAAQNASIQVLFSCKSEILPPPA